MSGKAKLASKNAGKKTRCPAHGHVCDDQHAVTQTVRVLEFRRSERGMLVPKTRWERT